MKKAGIMKKFVLVFMGFAGMVLAQSINLSGNYKIIEVSTEGSATQQMNGRMNFKNNAYNGSIGCNQFFGSVKQMGNVVDIGTSGVTKKSCDPDLEKKEQTFLGAFQGRFNVILKGGDVVLYNGKTSIVLNFIGS